MGKNILRGRPGHSLSQSHLDNRNLDLSFPTSQPFVLCKRIPCESPPKETLYLCIVQWGLELQLLPPPTFPLFCFVFFFSSVFRLFSIWFCYFLCFPFQAQLRVRRLAYSSGSQSHAPNRGDTHASIFMHTEYDADWSET